MKLLKALPVLILLTFFSGCIGDNMDDCPPLNNVILHFNYSSFPDHINRVNVGIFDKDGVHVLNQQVDKDDLNTFQGTYLTLNTGEYTAICWGNAFDDTRITCFDPNSSMHDGEVSHPNYGTSLQIPTHDSLYYGKHNFTVKSRNKVEHTVHFKPSHIKIHVYVKGLASLATNLLPSNYPVIRINNLNPACNFEMQTTGMSTTYHPTVKIDNTEKTAVARCNTLRFENDNPITIELLDNAIGNNILCTVGLRKFMEDNSITVQEGEELTIPILIQFKNGNITIELLKWEEVPVEPAI
ncbi:FimB/Mfa2 family fimbrial subunit [Dysgonomonas termitidis]|uniref:FimB/Mfa2 family fimbrial subunit n=1 Tax=Dysgonomonas termitidis TaxID=1516126 RepID=A0ABV9KUV0_9BACT